MSIRTKKQCICRPNLSSKPWSTGTIYPENTLKEGVVSVVWWYGSVVWQCGDVVKYSTCLVLVWCVWVLRIFFQNRSWGRSKVIIWSSGWLQFLMHLLEPKNDQFSSSCPNTFLVEFLKNSFTTWLPDPEIAPKKIPSPKYFFGDFGKYAPLAGLVFKTSTRLKLMNRHLFFHFR